MITLAGFDWVMIDLEHSTLSLNDMMTALQVMDNKIQRFVRVPGNDGIWLKRILDSGCDGIIVPMINTADEAENVILHSRYPPAGRRGVGLARAHKYGGGFKDYVSNANNDIIIMLQIEQIEAVRNIDAILKVKGYDLIFIGPYDLSASMGLTGQIDHPEVRKAIKTVKQKCHDAGIPYAIYGSSPEDLSKEKADGCSYFLYEVDISILSEAYRVLQSKMAAIRSAT